MTMTGSKSNGGSENSKIAQLIQLGRKNPISQPMTSSNYFPMLKQTSANWKKPLPLISADSYVEDSELLADASDKDLKEEAKHEQQTKETEQIDELANIETNDTIGLYFKRNQSSPGC